MHWFSELDSQRTKWERCVICVYRLFSIVWSAFSHRCQVDVSVYELREKERERADTHTWHNSCGARSTLTASDSIERRQNADTSMNVSSNTVITEKNGIILSLLVWFDCDSNMCMLMYMRVVCAIFFFSLIALLRAFSVKIYIYFLYCFLSTYTSLFSLSIQRSEMMARMSKSMCVLNVSSHLRLYAFFAPRCCCCCCFSCYLLIAERNGCTRVINFRVPFNLGKLVK